jgi:hypothetical protein
MLAARNPDRNGTPILGSPRHRRDNVRVVKR